MLTQNRTYFRSIVFLVLFLFVRVGATYSQSVNDQDEKAILKLIEDQRTAWNEGDVDGYMEGYWQSDSLMFIGKSGVVYGYDKTKERYLKNYPDKSAMGHLEFKIVQLQRLSDDAYHMVGKWDLAREPENIGGYFTLLFRKIGNQWLIVKDHTS